jgi:hypothetical protein
MSGDSRNGENYHTHGEVRSFSDGSRRAGERFVSSHNAVSLGKVSDDMNVLTASPRSPYLYAYLALLPGCLVGALGLLVYSLVSGPGAIDLGKFMLSLLLVFVWFGFALAVGALLVTFYSLPMIWLLLRVNVAGPALMFLISVLPGTALWLLGAAEYLKFSVFLLGFGASVGFSFCVLAYRRGDGGKS